MRHVLQPSFMQVLDWKAVREDVLKHNPTLTSIIDELNPDESYKFYRAVYPFGSEILENGIFKLPNSSGQLVPITDPSLPDSIREDLSYNYNSNPVSIVLKNSVELFISLEDRIAPHSFIETGTLFGLWKILDPTVSHCPPVFTWGMTAGARSLFMLSKISERASHDRLKKEYRLNVDKPRDSKDHWKVFRGIANNKNFSEKWTAELLFFSKKWFSHLDDPKWIRFENYLLKKAWESTQFWRNQYIWDLTFTRIQSRKRLKSSAYFSDLVKHILTMGVGAVPGFSPAIDNSAGPIKELQEVYLDVYNLKQYMPIIMQPKTIRDYTYHRPIYFSLQYPTAIELGPRSNDRVSAINDLYSIQSLYQKYISEIMDGNLNIETTPLAELPNMMQYDFYHNQATEDYPNIKNSKTILDEDDAFQATSDRFKDRRFPIDSSFFKGCVRISKR